MPESRMNVEVDAEHGGRWSSLRGRRGREWLWRRDAPERFAVRPGDKFVDAGGMEECLPAIGGEPDHDDAWARPWVPDGDGLFVSGGGVPAGPPDDDRRCWRDLCLPVGRQPGWWFVWAAHTLIGVSTSARLVAPVGRFMWVSDPDGTTRTEWPTFRGTDVSRLGEADGTALTIIVPELQ